MDIGIQSNLWDASYHGEKMPQMLAEIAEAGYDGIEIGAHRFENLDRPEIFLDMILEAGLQVSGIHTLGKFYFTGDLTYAERAADFTKAVGSKFMLVSGDSREMKTREDYKSMAAVLNQVGELCGERGLTYCYHNHWWEIHKDQEELQEICELTNPDLVSLCLDIGWVERAGASILDVTGGFIDRIQYFHLKDTREDVFTDLGEGRVDFPAFFEFIRPKAPFYLTHERDEVLPNAFESARKSRDYLLGLGV